MVCINSAVDCSPVLADQSRLTAKSGSEPLTALHCGFNVPQNKLYACVYLFEATPVRSADGDPGC